MHSFSNVAVVTHNNKQLIILELAYLVHGATLQTLYASRPTTGTIF